MMVPGIRISGDIRGALKLDNWQSYTLGWGGTTLILFKVFYLGLLYKYMPFFVYVCPYLLWKIDFPLISTITKMTNLS